jgi:hypothetical protein
MRRFDFPLFPLALLVAQPLVAATYYVGSCKNGAYSIISAAMATVAAGSTINVCPRTYAEQVVMSKGLTLKGISYSNSSQAVIAAPSRGLAMSSISLGGTVAAQVEVTVGSVNITNSKVLGPLIAVNLISQLYPAS